MSRVARSARVASKQRTELVTADKTVISAETGETYFCSGSAAITLTLPAASEGAYFEIINTGLMTEAVGFTGSNVIEGLVFTGIAGDDGAVLTRNVGADKYGYFMTCSLGQAGVARVTAMSYDASTYKWFLETHVSGTHNFTA